MYLYIVDYWVEFPSSEYGGVGIVLAENDKEAFNLLKESTHLTFDERDDDIKKAIKEAETFMIEDISEESRIVKTFYT